MAAAPPISTHRHPIVPAPRQAVSGAFLKRGAAGADLCTHRIARARTDGPMDDLIKEAKEAFEMCVAHEAEHRAEASRTDANRFGMV